MRDRPTVDRPMWRALLGAAAISLMAAPSPALAQSAAELKAQLDQMQQQVQQLAKKIEELEAGQEKVQASTDPRINKKLVGSGTEQLRLSVSGQVNRGVLYYDDGQDSEIRHVDNDNSSTRVRWDGRGQLTDELAIGARVEVQFESNSSANVNQADDVAGDNTTNTFTERKLEFFIDSDRLGTVWVGQGDTASNGTSEMDLSGTDVIGYSSIEDMAGGLSFVGSATGANLGTSVQIKDVFDNFDGLGRDDRLRYDTPKFNGFQASISAIDGGAMDVAGNYSASIYGVKVAAGVAYADASSIGKFPASGFTQVNGSASLLFPMGLNFTVAAGERDLEISTRDNPSFWYGKLGWQLENAFGKLSLAVDYTEVDDVVANGDQATAYGFFVAQKVDRAATDLFLGVRNHELDRSGTPTDDILGVLAGARVKF